MARARKESGDLGPVFVLTLEIRIAAEPLYQPSAEPVDFIIARLAPISERCLPPAVARVQRSPGANKVFDSLKGCHHRRCKREVQFVSAILVHSVQVQPVRYQ